MSMAKVLEFARTQQKMSQGDVALLCGMSRPRYNHYEAGDLVPSKHVKKVCTVLNITPNDLFEWKTPEYEDLRERVEHLEKIIERLTNVQQNRL